MFKETVDVIYIFSLDDIQQILSERNVNFFLVFSSFNCRLYVHTFISCIVYPASFNVLARSLGIILHIYCCWRLMNSKFENKISNIPRRGIITTERRALLTTSRHLNLYDKCSRIYVSLWFIK